MKKLFFAACALAMGLFAQAQDAQEVVYVEDCSQGVMNNSFKDNWFITTEGGMGLGFEQFATNLDFKDRLQPGASLYFGKWFSPAVAVRFGANMNITRSVSSADQAGIPLPGHPGLYSQKYMQVGPVFDAIVDLTNLCCGYRADRVYNFQVYGGAGGYWSFYDTGNPAKFFKNNWESMGDRILTVRVGLINTFHLSQHFDLALDLRYSPFDAHRNIESYVNNRTTNLVSAYIAATYRFGKSYWNCPMVPVCPPAEDCSALERELADANARISELERQLDTCLRRPAPQPVVEVVDDAPLATIYFPINVSKLTETDVTVLEAVAQVMKANPAQKYAVTGWADNYTGNDKINTRLRNERANSAATQLKAFGVPADQLNVTINAGNLSDLGEKFVALDRAVTIEKAK